MNLLSRGIAAEREFAALTERYGEARTRAARHPLLVTGLVDGAQTAFLLAAIPRFKEAGGGRATLVVLPDERELGRLSAAAEGTGLRTMTYPARDLQLHRAIASHAFEHERLGVLSALLAGCCDAVLTTPDALLQLTMPPERLSALSLTLSKTDPPTLTALTEYLVTAGYVRCETVDGMGTFARRGGILDVYPPQAEQPVRCEYFGDEIDRISRFDPETQRRTEELDTVSLSPARELLPDATARASLASAIAKAIRKCTDEAVLDGLRADAEALEADMLPQGIDRYCGLIYQTRTCLLDYFDARHDPCIVVNTQLCRDRLAAFEFEAHETVLSAVESGALSAKAAVFQKESSDFYWYTEQAGAVLVDPFATGNLGKLDGTFHFHTLPTVGYADSYDLLKEDLAHDCAAGYRTVLLCENETQRSALQASLYEDGISAILRDAQEDPASFPPSVPVLVVSRSGDGFVLESSRMAFLSLCNAQSVYRREPTVRHGRKKRSAAERIASYQDLSVGDYVVHESHGIGRYEGLRTITDIDGNRRDYVTIRYAGQDSLFIPCDQLDSVSKYIGAHAEDGTVKLSKMGGAEWKRATQRVRAATREMAKELILLYAARLRRPGFAFAPDEAMQHDFEETFPYEETDGQLVATREIKADMERPTPMDRLLCGDVGYGKTEVALRAAFKAALCGKQTALLVPTTILAMQHLQTVLARMRGFPVTAEVLSRFRTKKQQEEVLRRVRRGEVDLLIGTHRMLSRDVVFHDLGLVIVDEEQRFGVAHKEKLKTLSEGVDVLTLTATPIPRTLHMAMSGIRDMSILEQAPDNRLPVQTYVLEYDAVVLTEAIRKELRRGGQVFWLHNRVEDISSTAARIHEAVPDARIATAHGKTDREELERIWQDMINGEIDILVSTTIIETGVDIPNANTLIIENSDRMGLSQLHQIRGRIGRCGRRAYAYLTYPRGKVLSEVATKRLQAIRAFTEFGAGFKIAMRDLEIRGAGNVLGAEQHGHMDSVGYDLYIKLLNEAILSEKGEPVPVRESCTVTVRCDAYLPESYIKSPAGRIDAYRRIAAVETEEDCADIRDELCDRYGKPPRAAENLLCISLLRALGVLAGIGRIEQREGSILFFPRHIDTPRWLQLNASENNAKDGRGKLFLQLGSEPCITFRPRRGGEPVQLALSLLNDYLKTEPDVSGTKENP